MKFVISYSGGKDSVLSLHKMLEQGHEPVGLLVMFNEGQGRSWFHGLDPALLDEVSGALGIPLISCPSAGEDYHLAMERGLGQAKALGAEACAFGDIDIEGNRQWCVDRCNAVGLSCLHPLWQRGRMDNTRELLELGYKCLIKCVHNDLLPREYLGRTLDRGLIKEMEALGIDVCGENGEYHTLAVDGPAFHSPVRFVCGKVLDFGNISVIDIRAGC